MSDNFPVMGVVLVGLMSWITAGILLEEPKPDESSFIFGSAHEHALISVKIFGDEFDFSTIEYQLQSPFIHFENSNGHVIHRHSNGATIGYFFETMNLKLFSNCLIFNNKVEFCSDDEYTLKFYINGKKVDDLRDYQIIEGDLILISYGAENQKEIEKQLAELESKDFPFQLRERNNEYLDNF